jgi:phenylalanyl-tRNA synthetase beta chain
MRISENWLREWVNPDLSTDELVAQLTMAGLEVDSVEAAAPKLDNIVVAEVIKREKHPQADKLSLCQVDDGSGELVQVICGAANVREGLKVPFARIGAELPGFKIKKAKLRGVESFGMICSEQELQMADSSEGILELPADAPTGQAIVDYLRLNDALIEIDLTPNRGDCLSIAGVAREVAANNGLGVTPANTDAVNAEIDDRFDVELINGEACPAYTGRIIRGVNPSATTPMWMKEKLRRCGLRPISPVVDVTNFILIELGQPMHGFDFNKLCGGIRVRNARAGEKLELLDGTELECRDDTLVIADHDKALALAGIMGGMQSSVQDDTTDIFLEAAFFAPAFIAGKARSYGLHTDSSHRFERGVDPQLQARAMERATRLIIDIMGGQPGPVIQATSSAHLPVNPEVPLRHERIERMLGIEVSQQRVEEILTGLEMTLDGGNGEWTVRAPSYRFDITIEADLIEEIGRIIGYNNIPGKREAAHANMSSFSEQRLSLNQIRDALVGLGYYEAITYSFVSPEMQTILDPGQKTLTLSNPISADMSEMRTRLLPGLVQAVRHNLNRQQSRVRLFEAGLCFTPGESGLVQAPRVAAVISGSAQPESWGEKQRGADFFDIKGDLQSLMRVARGGAVEYRASQNPILHPGQSADILAEGRVIGFVGVLHPAVLKQLGVQQKLLAFEIEADYLTRSDLPRFSELSKFPVIRRDLALLVDQKVDAQQLINAIKSLQLGIIQDVFVFDVYTGTELKKNLKSIALGLILQDFSRTLTDEDVEGIVAQVLQILKNSYNAVLR